MLAGSIMSYVFGSVVELSSIFCPHRENCEKFFVTTNPSVSLFEQSSGAPFALHQPWYVVWTPNTPKAHLQDTVWDKVLMIYTWIVANIELKVWCEILAIARIDQ